MLLTSGGCMFPVVDKQRLNHRLLNQSARHNDYGIVTPHPRDKLAGVTLIPYFWGDFWFISSACYIATHPKGYYETPSNFC